ncbi:DUF456 domain-containing protein [Flavobacterium agricola]|uniref:DUF456 domain-containing protein n=1 Tax=Flavobacterium agricola TaxID=2870839 RepID=A0ABY6M0X4_9FLAO|nr:DUF456 domain-containing protein [Flavobacterium agricola]UYW01314.1 DUF456 domain-containing protein [Flavobacterium agricola]
MDYILLTISLVLMLAGIAGSLLPALPGPPLSWLGILVFYSIPEVPFNYYVVFISLFLTLVITVLDYTIPAQGTKRFGGSKHGIWGTNIGLVVGIFAPIPFGFIIGPFVGALLGELLFDKKGITHSLKAASGSFLGFLASTFMKFVFTMCFLGYFVYLVISYRSIWF